MKKIFVYFIFLICLFPSFTSAQTTEYELKIAFEEVNFTGHPAQAMTINGSIPGPTLYFHEGDTARIKVHNTMNVNTSIHWHGILLPPDMDGVPYVSFPPIKPGSTFTYEFPIRQSGTYWYHSHSGLQEQRGVYGAIVISPLQQNRHADREHTILFSDWTDEDPHQVLRTLKSGSEWYSIAKGSGQSILGAARLGMLGSYFKRELQRMPAMDIADIAYDRFLANGKPMLNLEASPRETLRLRFVNGSATTYFHLEFAGGPLQIIAADGIDVEPIEEQRLLIGVAETYDVLIKIPGTGRYELRATAHDGSGFASVLFGNGMVHLAPDLPKPNLYHAMGTLTIKQLFAFTPAASMNMPDKMVASGMFDQPGMMAMESMSMDSSGHEMNHTANPKQYMDMGHDASHDSEVAPMGHSQMAPAHSMKHNDMETAKNNMGSMADKHESMDMSLKAHHPNDMPSSERNGKRFATNFAMLASDVSSSPALAMDGMDNTRPWSPYEKLRATAPTAFSDSQTPREIRLTLDGDMERYVWFFNNKALSETDSILIREGEVVRFIMINRTMMHHPIHLHGHFFRVLNRHGDYSPLKHTVDVAPMSTTVIEFNANEVGDWFFHCHLLYHMKTGMTRLVHYENFTPSAEVNEIRPQLYKDPWYFNGQADLLSNMSEGLLQLADTRKTIRADWEIGWEEVEKNEWEGVLTLSWYVNRFFDLFAGADSLGEASETDHVRAVLGFGYLLPLNIESHSWVDSDGGARFMFDKEFTITPRLSLIGETEYDTHKTKWESKAALNYTLSKHFSVIGQWHSDYDWGVGLQVRF